MVEGCGGAKEGQAEKKMEGTRQPTDGSGLTPGSRFGNKSTIPQDGRADRHSCDLCGVAN